MTVATYQDISTLTPGRFHRATFGRSRSELLYLPFGGERPHGLLYLRNGGGELERTALLAPEEIEDFARDGLPLDHLASAISGRDDGMVVSTEEALERVREASAEDPPEADPEATDPESVQSDTEADAYNNHQKIVATLEGVFENGLPDLSNKSVIDETYLGGDQAKPLRIVGIVFTADGRPLPEHTSNFFYRGDKPWFVLTQFRETLELEHYRKVLIEETQESSSISAGLNLMFASPTPAVSSGPKPGDKVKDHGKAKQTSAGGGGIGFNFAWSKSWMRLRIETELRMTEKLGGMKSMVTTLPS